MAVDEHSPEYSAPSTVPDAAISGNSVIETDDEYALLSLSGSTEEHPASVVVPK